MGLAAAASLEGFPYRGSRYWNYYRRRLLIGEEVGLGATRGTHTVGPRGQGLGRAALAWRHLVAPIRFPFGLLEASWKNKILGVDFVQFREYFLTRISETKKQQKTGTGASASC